jgi:hypothetical protein
VLVAVAAPKVAEGEVRDAAVAFVAMRVVAVSFVAMIEGVVIVPAALIVVVPVAPKAVGPKKLSELAKEEAPVTVSAGVMRVPESVPPESGR